MGALLHPPTPDAPRRVPFLMAEHSGSPYTGQGCELVTRCIGAGGAAWDPGGAEWRTAESTGLQRRHGNGRALARLGLRAGEKGEHVWVMRRRDRAEEQWVPRLFGDRTRRKGQIDSPYRVVTVASLIKT